MINVTKAFRIGYPNPIRSVNALESCIRTYTYCKERTYTIIGIHNSKAVPTAALRAYLFAKDSIMHDVEVNLHVSPTLTPQPKFPMMSIAFGALSIEGNYSLQNAK